MFTKEFLRATFGMEKAAIQTSELFFVAGTIIYIITVYDLLKLFTQNRFILNTILASFIITFAVICFIQNPFFILTIESKKYYMLPMQICFSIGTFTVIFYTIKEIFDDETTQTERLWGAACVYFMIAWAFGGVYDIIGILDNNALGKAQEVGTTLTYIEATAYSMSVLGNFNQLYEKVSPLMARVAVIEAVWAHLFVVLVVGRLLSK